MVPPFQLAIVGVDHPHGAGWRQLLRNFDDVNITAIVPGYDGSTTSLEEAYARVPRFDTTQALIADGRCDGALVCLPNDTGPQAVIDLALAGKHVLVEKPVAGSHEQAQRVAEAVRRSDVAFQTGYVWRYNEASQRLRRMVRDGQFGRLINVEITFVTSDVRRRGPDHYLFDPHVSEAGFFNWLACHFLDLLLYITGEAVIGVTARTGVFGASDVNVEDGGAAIFDLEKGGLAQFVGGYWLPRWAGESRWTLRGTQRWVEWEPAGTGGLLRIHGPKPQWHAMEETFVMPADDTPGYGGKDGHALVSEWLNAARHAGGTCRNTVDSMLATLQLIDAIYQASREQRRIACHVGPA